MCHIAYIPYKKFPDDEELRKFLDQMFYINSDGCGVSFFEKGTNEPYLYRSLNSIHAVIDEIKDKESVSGFLIHTRIASIGAVRMSNCHPFYIGNNKFLAHNGTMSSIKVCNGDSDTYRLADMMKRMKDKWNPLRLLNYFVKREKFDSNTFIIQGIDNVIVQNNYRLCKAQTDNGTILWTSANLGMLESTTLEYGAHTLFPIEDVKYRAATQKNYRVAQGWECPSESDNKDLISWAKEYGNKQ